MKWKTIHCQKEEVMPMNDKMLIFLSRFIMALFAALLILSALMLFTGCKEVGVKTETVTEYITEDEQTTEQDIIVGQWVRGGQLLEIRNDGTMTFYTIIDDSVSDYGTYYMVGNVLFMHSDDNGADARYIYEIEKRNDPVKGYIYVMGWTYENGSYIEWEKQ